MSPTIDNKEAEKEITGLIQVGKLRVSQALGCDGLATVSAENSSTANLNHEH